ncbi:DNA2/NAM7 family helicase [Halosquirtibacter xylanolyticus]|uniref:DEAD/DEAH box helicase n=1 Tax=Halosquirtibacter xylanolyticus TaxID=3374599 RepID=UPI003747C3AA|nr:DNA2/NAM7 family helicase [Prolixibacteraceae bacterium]
MESYIDQLKDFIDAECDAQNKQVEDIWALTIDERIELGHAIDNITVWTVLDGIDWSRRGRAFLKLSYNNSNLRAGSRIRLHKGDPEINYFCCEVTKEHPGYYEIKASYGCNLVNITHNSSGWILDPDRIDLRHMLKNTVESVLHTPFGNDIFGQLKGMIAPVVTTYNSDLVETNMKQYGFNQSQSIAFTNALHTSNYYTIQGPPGTGKTMVLAYLALYLAKQGKNVLITAFTHRAINNALRKVRSLESYRKMFKIGPIEQAEDLITESFTIDNFEYFIQSPYNSLNTGIIVGASPMSLRSKRVGSLRFDVAIIDEAGQLTQPLAISVMLSCVQTVWIGDHKQMPPVLVASHTEKEVIRSAFECLTEKYNGTMLRTTYRMNEIINSIPSRYFYNDGLKSADVIAKNRIRLRDVEPRFSFLSDPDLASVFIETNHSRCKVQSKKEALVIRQLSEVLINAGMPPENIGVVTPYRAHARLVSQHLSEINCKEKQVDLSSIVVDTVERMQGQEREVIFFSLVISSLDHISHGIDFYFNLNRWNVAMTRAKTKMIWVGNPNVFTQLKQRFPNDNKMMTFCDIVESLPKVHTSK